MCSISKLPFRWARDGVAATKRVLLERCEMCEGAMVNSA
jgi:hypothetical protein